MAFSLWYLKNPETLLIPVSGETIFSLLQMKLLKSANVIGQVRMMQSACYPVIGMLPSVQKHCVL